MQTPPPPTLAVSAAGSPCSHSGAALVLAFDLSWVLKSQLQLLGSASQEIPGQGSSPSHHQGLPIFWMEQVSTSKEGALPEPAGKVGCSAHPS